MAPDAPGSSAFFQKNVYEPAMLLWGALDFASQSWPYARACSLTNRHYFEHACQATPLMEIR